MLGPRAAISDGTFAAIADSGTSYCLAVPATVTTTTVRPVPNHRFPEASVVIPYSIPARRPRSGKGTVSTTLPLPSKRSADRPRGETLTAHAPSPDDDPTTAIRSAPLGWLATSGLPSPLLVGRAFAGSAPAEVLGAAPVAVRSTPGRAPDEHPVTVRATRATPTSASDTDDAMLQMGLGTWVTTPTGFRCEDCHGSPCPSRRSRWRDSERLPPPGSCQVIPSRFPVLPIDFCQARVPVPLPWCTPRRPGEVSFGPEERPPEESDHGHQRGIPPPPLPATRGRSRT